VERAVEGAGAAEVTDAGEDTVEATSDGLDGSVGDMVGLQFHDFYLESLLNK
jgi:hypothetical protein